MDEETPKTCIAINGYEYLKVVRKANNYSSSFGVLA